MVIEENEFWDGFAAVGEVSDEDVFVCLAGDVSDVEVRGLVADFLEDGGMANDVAAPVFGDGDDVDGFGDGVELLDDGVVEDLCFVDFLDHVDVFFVFTIGEPCVEIGA